jgi:hypothetical protein
MNSKKAGIIFLLILVLAYMLVQRLQHQPDASHTLRQRGFDRRISTVEYTQHARCRMQCRQISQSDINEIMHRGEINYAKSDVEDKPCPTYALQGYTNDGQHLRVIFAQCETKTKVVTAYDLEKDFECHCPGDEKRNAR